jgi:hypothetical protein
MSEKWERFAAAARALTSDVKKRTEEALRDHEAERHGEGDRIPGRGRRRVTDSTFLVIPAFEGDSGARPVAQGIKTWHSPAVNVIDESLDPASSLESIQGTFSPKLTAGHTYLFEAWVHNHGDLPAPAVNVEFFLRSVGMGATAESARLVGRTVIAIGRNARSRATVPFTAATADLGHQCLLVRASSFNPPDFPADWSLLLARESRHVGQQNLNVVAGSSVMSMMLNAPAGGRRSSTTIRIRVLPADVPMHLKNNACLADRMTLAKGLGRAAFNFESDAPFRKTEGATNSWDVKVPRKATCNFRLTMPRTTDRVATVRVYDVEAYDVETRKVFDGVTVLVR